MEDDDMDGLHVEIGHVVGISFIRDIDSTPIYSNACELR